MIGLKDFVDRLGGGKTARTLGRASMSVSEGWTRGALARNSRGWPVAPTNPEAESWCMLGAIHAAANGYGDTPRAVRDAMKDAVRELLPYVKSTRHHAKDCPDEQHIMWRNDSYGACQQRAAFDLLRAAISAALKTYGDTPDTIATLVFARGLLARGWTQGTLARDERQEPVPVHSPRASQWCMSGAVREVAIAVAGTANEAEAIVENVYCALADALPQSFARTRFSAEYYNDAPHRTSEEVQAVFTRAIEKLMEEAR